MLSPLQARSAATSRSSCRHAGGGLLPAVQASCIGGATANVQRSGQRSITVRSTTTGIDRKETNLPERPAIHYRAIDGRALLCTVCALATPVLEERDGEETYCSDRARFHLTHLAGSFSAAMKMLVEAERQFATSLAEGVDSLLKGGPTGDDNAPWMSNSNGTTPGEIPPEGFDDVTPTQIGDRWVPAGGGHFEPYMFCGEPLPRARRSRR